MSAKDSVRHTSQDLKILKYLMAAFFITMTVVFPLFIPTQYFFVIQHKTNFFYVVTAIFSVLAIPFFIANRFQVKDYFVDNEPVRRITIPEIALIAFVWLTLLSAIFSPWQDSVWFGYEGRYEGFWAFLCYGMTFFLIARFYHPRRSHMVILSAGAILLSLYGILQFFGIDPLNLFPFTLNDPRFVDASGTQLYGNISALYRTTLGNTNVVAAYCSFTAVLFPALYTVEKSRLRFIYLAAGIVCFALLLVSNGDGGKVGVLGAMVLLIPYWFSDRERLGKIFITLSGWAAVFSGYQAYMTFMKTKIETLPPYDQNYLRGFSTVNPVIFVVLAAFLLMAGLFLLYKLKKWPGKAMTIAGIAALILGALGGVLLIEVLGARFSDQPGNIIFQAREILHGNMDDSFGTNRGWAWKRGFSVIPENPILGTGPDTFFHALGPELQEEAVARYGVFFDKAHNLFLQIAVCMGIPALLAFLTFLGGLFVPAVKKAFNRPLLLAFGGAALGYLIQCFFEVDMPVDKPLLWVALGIMAGELWREKAGA